jgi:hypothetical protein
LAIKEQGRKKSWIAEQLGLSRPTLDKRIDGNSFTDIEINRLQELQLL